jgi:hypothetical protein
VHRGADPDIMTQARLATDLAHEVKKKVDFHVMAAHEEVDGERMQQSNNGLETIS